MSDHDLAPGDLVIIDEYRVFRVVERTSSRGEGTFLGHGPYHGSTADTAARPTDRITSVHPPETNPWTVLEEDETDEEGEGEDA